MLNQKLQTITQSGTVALADRVRQLEREGKKIIPLHTGDPDFATPAIITEAAYRAIRDGFTHYADSKGLLPLREEICNYLLKFNQAKFDPGTEVLVSQGGIHAYFLALTAILNTGDEVLLAGPSWGSHANIIKLTGGVPVSVLSDQAGRFIPSVDAYRKLLTPKTKAIVLNSPGNPTGEIIDKAALLELLEFAQEHQLYVISDEVYDQIVFEGRKFISASSFPEFKERVIICNSFSKTFAMTGWRIGYLAGPAEVVKNALKVSQGTITNVAAFMQLAALEGLRSAAVWEQVTQMRKHYEYRADEVMNLYKQAGTSGIELKKPEGAFYFFARIDKLNAGSAEQVAMAILEKLSVAVVPGSVFGQGGEGYLRMTFAASDEHVFEGFKRILSFNTNV